tara:strand:+ start:1036 stop:1503 length:468 start_codon:yes stop_codon:yes gene_type:complete
MIDKQNLKGSCACGEVEYTIIDEPLFTQACHCKNCKKSTGSSFVIHTMIFEDDLVLKGKVSSTELPTGSGKGYRAYFCVNCGVYLYCKYKVAPGRIAVRVATLDIPITPQAHIFVKDKDPWIQITNKEICFDIMYDRAKIWPDKSLKRLDQKNKI